MQIPNLVSLVRCERNGPNCSVAAFILLPIRLGDEGLHLHIAGRHQRSGYAVKVDPLVSLVDMVGFQFRGSAIRQNETGLNLQRPLQLFRKFLSPFNGSTQDT